MDDTANHSVAPAYLLKAHGISDLESRTFSLSNGQQIIRALGIAHFEIDGRSLPCPIVFGPDDGPFLIGASALSIFNLTAAPETRKLEPETFLSLGTADQHGQKSWRRHGGLLVRESIIQNAGHLTTRQAKHRTPSRLDRHNREPWR